MFIPNRSSLHGLLFLLTRKLNIQSDISPLNDAITAMKNEKDALVEDIVDLEKEIKEHERKMAELEKIQEDKKIDQDKLFELEEEVRADHSWWNAVKS